MGEVRRPTYTTTDPKTGERVTRESRVWWVRYYRDGRRHEESSGSTRRSDAERLLKVREGAVAKGERVSAEVGRLTFDQAAADVVRDYKLNERHTLRDLRCRLDMHLLPYFGHQRMASITTADVRAYAEHRQGEGASNATINRELTALKRAFKLAQHAGTVLQSPHVPLLREAPPRSGFFERAEFEAVRANLPEHLRGVVTLMYLTGWRVSEVLGLEWRQVDRKTRTVRLDHGQTKNREGRLLPYGKLPELAEVIDTAWGEHQRLAGAGVLCPLVFHQRGGQRIGSFRKAWATACRLAGCPGKLRHDFRRTAVRNLVRAGVPDTVAMKVTGHKTRSVFDRYNITAEADLRDALGKLSSSSRDSATGKEKGKGVESGEVVEAVSP